MGRMQFPTKQPMPGNVRSALEKRKLMDTYLGRPVYQKDEYLKWIALAVGPLAKQQRLDQMLDELEKGGAFKGEPWTPPEPITPVRAAPEPEKPAPAPAKAASKPAPAAKPASAPAKAKSPVKPPATKAPARKKSG